MVSTTETLTGALDDVRAFCAVVELGSISAAARRLGETKGGLSRRVSRLERRLNAALLTRTPRAVSTTEEGLAFYGQARDALALLDDAAESARQARAVPRGHLRVTAPHDLGLDVLPELLAGFRIRHPQITVELVLTDALLDLAAHRIDLALRATAAVLPDSAYRASLLIEFRMALYASPLYLAQRPPPDSPEELEAHDLIGSQDATRAGIAWNLVRARKRFEFRARPVMQASDYAGVHRLLLAGAGIGAIPDIVAAASVRSGKLERVLPRWHGGPSWLYAISVGGREAPARVRVFRAFMREELRRLLVDA